MGLLSKKLFLDGVQHRKAGPGPEMIRENFSSLEALHTCFDVGFSLFLFSTQIFFVRFLVTVCSYYASCHVSRSCAHLFMILAAMSLLRRLP